MSRVINVLKNRNRLEKLEKERSKTEMENMRLDTAYRAKLIEVMDAIQMILDIEGVKSVVINIPEVHISRFMKTLYLEEMSQYNIKQLNELQYEISNKVINF